MDYSIKKAWHKVWTTEYCMVSVCLFADEYIKSCKKILGRGFEEVIFSSSEGLATVYRIESEIKSFSRFLANKLLKNDKFREKVYERNLELNNALLRIMSLSPEEFLTADNIDLFIKIHHEFLPFFLTVLWAPNELTSVNADNNLKDKVFAECLKIRKHTEHTYPDLEKYFKKVFYFIADKEGIDSVFLSALLPQELSGYAKAGKLPKAADLQVRYKLYIAIANKEKKKIFVGKRADEILNKIENSDTKGISEFKGIVANPGKWQGRVTLLFTDRDQKKFKKGEVLVTVMTRPDWLPAMKLAGAYITDAGGILCHAAIVSRELNKPCIIGAKIATKILKDGDMVEVDADKGVVRIIKRK